MHSLKKTITATLYVDFKVANHSNVQKAKVKKELNAFIQKMNEVMSNVKIEIDTIEHHLELNSYEFNHRIEPSDKKYLEEY